MIPAELVPHLLEIEESIIRKAAETLPGDSFSQLIIYGEIYKKHGLEPVYLTTADMEHYTVTCRETLGKRLH